MSYSVFRIQGIKTTSDLKGVSKHDKDRVSHTNKDIDKDRSNENITLIECENYNAKFNKIVEPMKEEHTERMKTMRADRIKTFDQHINSSKNDIACEMIFTSDNEFFKDMNKDDIKKWAEKSLDFVTKDIGIERKNIIHAVVHMDEKTPHLHVVAVPLVKTYNKKQKRDVWSISRRQYINGKQQLSVAQDIYNKRMNENGYKLERGEKGSEKVHTTKADYEKQQLLQIKREARKAQDELSVTQNKKEDIENHINTLERLLKALESDYKVTKDIRSTIWDIDRIEVKKSLLGGTVTLKKDDYEKLTGLAKQGVHNASKIEKLEYDNTDFEKSRDNFRNENYKLKEENKELRGMINKYKNQYPTMYQVLKENNLLGEVSKRINAPQKNKENSLGYDR